MGFCAFVFNRQIEGIVNNITEKGRNSVYIVMLFVIYGINGVK